MNIAELHTKIADFQRRLETVPDATAECVTYNADELLDLRKDEILLGRDSDGQPFSPGYTEDPYFKTPQQAAAYAAMKDRQLAGHNARIMHPLSYPGKDRDTPNLIVTGSFQDAMFIRTDRTSFIIGSQYDDASAISAKYGGRVYGPGPEAKKYFWRWILFPALYSHIWQ